MDTKQQAAEVRSARVRRTDLPLRNLRLQSGKKLAEVTELFSKKVGRPIKSPYIIVLEHRGTINYSYISAFAEIYNVKPDVVAAAATPPAK